MNLLSHAFRPEQKEIQNLSVWLTYQLSPLLGCFSLIYCSDRFILFTPDSIAVTHIVASWHSLRLLALDSIACNNCCSWDSCFCHLQINLIYLCLSCKWCTRQSTHWRPLLQEYQKWISLREQYFQETFDACDDEWKQKMKEKQVCFIHAHLTSWFPQNALQVLFESSIQKIVFAATLFPSCDDESSSILQVP